MKTWHVTYFYLATGMEGRADKQDYGFVDAETKEEAKEKAARRRCPEISERDLQWTIGCLTAKEA